MKKSTFIVGVISCSLFSIGILMKIMHWPFASIILTLAGLIFAAGYASLLLIDKNKLSQNSYQNFVNLMTYFSMAIITVAFIFKAQHWPGANIGIYAGHVCLVTMIPILFIQGSKETDPVKKLNFNNTAIMLVMLTAFSFYIWLRINTGT